MLTTLDASAVVRPTHSCLSMPISHARRWVITVGGEPRSGVVGGDFSQLVAPSQLCIIFQYDAVQSKA